MRHRKCEAKQGVHDAITYCLKINLVSIMYIPIFILSFLNAQDKFRIFETRTIFIKLNMTDNKYYIGIYLIYLGI